MSYALSGTILRAGRLEAGTVAVGDDGRIAERAAGTAVALPTGWVLAPGMVDLQVNGFAGAAIGADPRENARVARALPRAGVTSFCPTVITASPDGYAATAAALRATRWPRDGARPLGVHLEGPFLAPARAGAHPPELLLAPSPDALDRLMRTFDPAIVTLAPELPGALAAVARVASSGAVAALGHTDAGATTARRALHAGARLLTHAFNAMRGVEHRAPTALTALLGDARCHVSLIGDGVHVAPEAAALAAARAGGRLVLVSDAVAAAGAPPGRYALGRRPVLSDGRRVVDEDGRLAGAARGLDAGPRTLAAAGVGRDAALAAACEAPRRLMGLEMPPSPGAAADLVILDGDLRVRATLLAGRLVHASGPLPSALAARLPAG